MIRFAGPGMGVVWLAILLVLILAVLVVITVRLFVMQPWRPSRQVPLGAVPPGAVPPGAVPSMPGHAPTSPHPGSAREILDARLARGEITPEQYRELRQTLEG
ncbi:SHOCT domain-containing protein [Sinomonas sp. ASV322]|uniref:SHOCT domain-containing protein n=1 Tax=Sinomonas sp. ASV322 TaxID=3041920 RepID=UPI0027DCBE66|nr:SHOCT domain-containing protein [Sinomonas sp. ASV322]MDQ4503027.1 SHOCT domain-containing protein [Sinomonas sp. ASV322]